MAVVNGQSSLSWLKVSYHQFQSSKTVHAHCFQLHFLGGNKDRAYILFPHRQNTVLPHYHKFGHY